MERGWISSFGDLALGGGSRCVCYTSFLFYSYDGNERRRKLRLLVAKAHVEKAGCWRCEEAYVSDFFNGLFLREYVFILFTQLFHISDSVHL